MTGLPPNVAATLGTSTCTKCGASFARIAERCRACRRKREKIRRKLSYARRWAEHAATPAARERNAALVPVLEQQLAES